MLDKVLPIKYFTWGQYLLFSSKSYSDCRNPPYLLSRQIDHVAISATLAIVHR